MTSVAKVRLRVLRAAVEWWKQHKPLTFSLEEHLRNPTINIPGYHHDATLARAVAALVKTSWQSDEASSLVADLYIYARLLEKGKSLHEKAVLMRRAEAFLEIRSVEDDTTPKEAPRATKLTRKR